MQKILIYIEEPNTKVKYVFTQLIKHILGLDFDFCFRKEEFIHEKQPKISYGSYALSDEIFLRRSDFFQKTHLSELQAYLSQESFYQDKVAVCFALLTRIEEYNPKKTDLFGRFPYPESILFKKIAIEEPYVDRFAFELLSKLQEKFPTLNCSKKIQELPTVDLDHPFMILHKTPKRILFSFLHSLKKGNLKEIVQKIKILLRFQKDPYDIYAHSNTIENLLYFLPVGSFNKKKNDTFHSLKNKSYIQFLQKLSLHKNIYLHPSYASNESEKKLKEEISLYTDIFDEKPQGSRQHFIKLEFPKTYQNLIKNGIYKDYSMGFPEKPGFRAGTCSIFYWFDLEKNTTTNLQIFPFCWMDATFLRYIHASEEQTREDIKKLKETCIKYQGLYSYILHNENYFRFTKQYLPSL